jgi:cytidyltransferase-like protein
MGKIVSIRKLRKINFKNLKTVLVGGSFDILNIGHVRFLSRCKKFGDILIVGVADDKNVRDRKGPLRPIIPSKQRAEIISALKPVDYVFISNLSAYNDKILKLIRPNIVVIPLEKGKVKKRKKRKKEIELKFPFIKVKLLDRTRSKIHSTTIIEKIIKKYIKK